MKHGIVTSLSWWSTVTFPRWRSWWRTWRRRGKRRRVSPSAATSSSSVSTFYRQKFRNSSFSFIKVHSYHIYKQNILWKGVPKVPVRLMQNIFEKLWIRISVSKQRFTCAFFQGFYLWLNDWISIRRRSPTYLQSLSTCRRRWAAGPPGDQSTPASGTVSNGLYATVFTGVLWQVPGALTF
jgi:hypothetical protein